MMLPRISIVTCSYQQGRFLDATMRSVLDQDYENLEYIVMDGGSRDGSVEIIRRHAARLAYWSSAKDAGQTDALARGFERSTGEVMGWLCSDDLLLPGALASVGRFFATNSDVDVVYGNALWIDESGRLIRPKREMAFNRFVFLFDHNYLPQPSVFWRRSLYERVGGLDRRFDLAMDSDLWERFSRVADLKHCNEYWSGMRRYAAQKTQALRPRGQREDAILRSRHILGRSRAVGRLLHPFAKVVRVVNRVANGGYSARVSNEILNDLRKYETPILAGKS